MTLHFMNDWQILNGHRNNVLLGFILPTKKVRKISGFLTKFSVFGYLNPTKNSWILFSEIWPTSCTKNWIQFFIFIQKNWEFKMLIYPKNWIWDFLLVGLSPGLQGIVQIEVNVSKLRWILLLINCKKAVLGCGSSLKNDSIF